MSNTGDNGSWTPQGNDFNAQNGGHDASAQPAQDPWAQPPAGQDPYAQPSAGSAADPYGQASGASASDPYGQQGTGQGSYGQDPFAQDASAQPGQDPWAQPPAGQDPYGQPSGGSAADPYGQASGASASDPYGQPGAGQNPYGQPSGASASDPYGQPGPGQGQQNWSAAGPGASASDPYGQAPGTGPAPQGEAQSRLLVGLLGIFLGGFGVHRFLMGYTTIGIIQIVVTVVTCGFGSLWGLVEGIMVLAKSPSFERDAHGRPLTD